VDELHTFKFSNLLVIPSFIGLFNVLAVVAGLARVFMQSGGASKEWGKLFGKLCFSFWVLVHMYPFAKVRTEDLSCAERLFDFASILAALPMFPGGVVRGR
jgi:hypothetical protein